jgi:hypothetical protein
MLKFQLKYQNESEVVAESNQRQKEAERQINRFEFAFGMKEEQEAMRMVLRIKSDKLWDPKLGEIKSK